MKKEIIIEIICFLFIVLFVYAAVNKLMDVQKFKVQIGQSPLLTAFPEIIAWTVPSVEVLIAIMIAIPKLRLIALYCSFSLMVIFTTYIVIILNFSFYVPCSCGGILEKLGWTEHLIFNIAFIMLALVGIILQNKEGDKRAMIA